MKQDCSASSATAFSISIPFNQQAYPLSPNSFTAYEPSQKLLLFQQNIPIHQSLHSLMQLLIERRRRCPAQCDCRNRCSRDHCYGGGRQPTADCHSLRWSSHSMVLVRRECGHCGRSRQCECLGLRQGDHNGKISLGLHGQTYHLGQGLYLGVVRRVRPRKA